MRGQRPIGALDDVKNFVPNIKMGGLVQRRGYEDVDAYTGTITATDGTTSITNKDRIWYLSTENPESENILLIGGRGSESPTPLWHVFQTPHWHNGTTHADTLLCWGESLAITVVTASGTTVTFSGGSATENYYKNWILYDDSTAILVTASIKAAGTTTLTTLQNVHSGLSGAATLYRHFHDNPTFSVGWNGYDPVALQQGDSILYSGGQDSSTTCKPVWSGFVNKTFFSGDAKNYLFQGTYVTEAEIKSTAGITVENADQTNDTAGLDATCNWFIAFCIETDDGQFSSMIKASTNYITPSDASQAITTIFKVNPALLNKRARYINVFLGKSETTNETSIDWSQYYYIKSYDLASNTGWTYQETATTVPGYFYFTVQLDIGDWNASNPDIEETRSFVDHTGCTAYNNSTVSFSKAVFVNNRLFVAKFYDYTSALNYNDQVRYSGFGWNGVPQHNVLPDIDDFSQSTIESGDPASIQFIGKHQSNLFIIKNRSCYYVTIGADSAQWELVTVSKELGTDTPLACTMTPYGVIFIKSGQDVFLWSGGQPMPMTTNWRDTFRTYTTSPANWLGYYDANEKTYTLFPSVSSAYKTGFQMFFERPIEGSYEWYKQVYTNDFESVAIRSDGVVYFLDSGSIFYLSESLLDDNGTDISCYFDTGDYVLSEEDITRVLNWYLSCSVDGSATWANDLDVKVYIDGTSTGTFTGLTKTRSYFRTKMPLTANGTRFRFEYNTNATPATYAPSSATAQRLTINELGFNVEIVPRVGDLQTLL